MLCTGTNLFSMIFSAMLTDDFHECDDGFSVRYRVDGKMFNLRRIQVKSKVQTEVVDERLYADGMAQNVSTERKVHEAMDCSQSCDNYYLKISTKRLMLCSCKRMESTTMSQQSQ